MNNCSFHIHIKRGMQLLILIFLFILPQFISAQHSRYIVYFKDKAGTSFSISSPSSYLSSKSIDRRIRFGIPIDSTDLPVSSSYISQLQQIENLEVVSSSKWLNAVLIKINNPVTLDEVQQLPFVKSKKAIANIAFPLADIPFEDQKNYSVQPLPSNEILSSRAGLNLLLNENILSYGQSENQISVHNGNFLHNKGFTGKGITIAMIDAGYTAYHTNPAFDSIRNSGRILGGYDFVLNNPGVSTHHTHGSYCLSVIASNLPGKMVGSAPGAAFWLLRTEDAASEYLIEEYYWAKAAEFADSAGADMISSSLGYTSFDDPAMNHSYSDRDGNSSMATIAADLAAKKGIIVVNSAGNSGGFASDERYISCPADGDSVLAVGAVKHNLEIAAFSSWGPNSNGKIKPNVVSIGEGTILVNATGNPVSGNGTSFSAPNISGLIASLWQAFPDFNNMEILAAVENSAHKRNNPDERFGYGIPDFKLAYEELLNARVKRNLQNLLEDNNFKIFPNPYHNSFNIAFIPRTSGITYIQVSDAVGRVILHRQVTVTEGEAFNLPIHSLSEMPVGLYLISIIDSKGIRTKKLIKARF